MAETPNIAKRPHDDADGLAICLAVLDGLPAPIILVDRRRNVSGFNQAARDRLGIDQTGQNLAVSLRHPDVIEAVDAVLAGAPPRTLEISIPAPITHSFSVHVAAPALEGGPLSLGAVLLLREMTGEKILDLVRADFVANVSHELRSPLAALVGFIETLKGPARDDKEARARFLDTMERESNRMARLIDDLLSLSRVEINEHVPPLGKFDVAAVIGEVAELLEPKAKAKNMDIVLDFPKGLPRVIGERDELTEVFQNLIDNAITYGREGTPVRVVARPRDEIPGNRSAGLSVSVEDQGEGIPRQEIPRLTERFYRIDKARSRSLGGTGLGLAIVKHIVSRHRGRLSIQSTVGEGSTFTVTLPTVPS